MSLEPQSMNSGIERAALMISEEKHQQDSRKNKKIHPQKFINQFQSFLFVFKIYLYWKNHEEAF